MRCIGINQWAGVEPWLADEITVFEERAAERIRAENERWASMMPRAKFMELAKQRFTKPKLFGVLPTDGLWRIGDYTLVEFSELVLSDATDSESFLVHLQSLYVVDTERGRGEGRRAIEMIKGIADAAGCGVTLFARAFGFSKDSVRPHALISYDDLWEAAVVQQWPVIYLPKWDAECLRFFYECCGFTNMCLYDNAVFGRPKDRDQPFESQFAYLPSSLEPRWLNQIGHRLNRDLCEFCNR